MTRTFWKQQNGYTSWHIQFSLAFFEGYILILITKYQRKKDLTEEKEGILHSCKSVMHASFGWTVEVHSFPYHLNYSSFCSVGNDGPLLSLLLTSQVLNGHLLHFLNNLNEEIDRFSALQRPILCFFPFLLYWKLNAHRLLEPIDSAIVFYLFQIPFNE